MGLEEAAVRIRTYEIQVIPGLLQTEDYARAIISQALERRPADEIDRWVSVRLQRQRVLTRPNPPRLWAVVDEAALRRQIGGREVMRGQLEHLLAMAKLPNVTLQLMPFHAGGHPAQGGAFVIFRFADPDLPDIVYLEQLASALYLDKRDDVDRYAETMDRLSVQAESGQRTISSIEKMLTEV
jgi:hypothetical protein